MNTVYDMEKNEKTVKLSIPSATRLTNRISINDKTNRNIERENKTKKNLNLRTNNPPKRPNRFHKKSNWHFPSVPHKKQYSVCVRTKIDFKHGYDNTATNIAATKDAKSKPLKAITKTIRYDGSRMATTNTSKSFTDITLIFLLIIGGLIVK